MKEKDLARIGFMTLIVFAVFGGERALLAIKNGLIDIVSALFPFIVEVTKRALVDYLTSAYFIVRVIMVLGSCCGVWVGHQDGKRLYIIISTVLGIYGLLSGAIPLLEILC